jgi:hypothetical protein
MRNLRYLIAVTLFCGLTAAANAAQVNFQVIVIDPNPANVFHLTDSTLQPLSVNWGSCAGNPAPITHFDGCFSIENETTHTITTLTLFMANAQNSNPNACPTFANDAFLNAPVCTNTLGGFLVYLSGGNILPASHHNDFRDDDRDDDDANPSIFTIGEDGVNDPNRNLVTTATVNSPTPAATPEPNSLLLLATGVLTGGGLMLGDWRRRMAATRSL